MIGRRAIFGITRRDQQMYFSDLVNEIKITWKIKQREIREALPLFYTELNVDGSFIPLGDNKWDSPWYAIDEVDEEIIVWRNRWRWTPKKRKKTSMLSWMETKMRSTTMTTIQKTKKFTKQIQLFLHDEENPDTKEEVEVTMLKSMNKNSDDLGEEVELSWRRRRRRGLEDKEEE